MLICVASNSSWINSCKLSWSYGGEPTGCRNFMLACELYLSEFLERKVKQKIATLIQRLTGCSGSVLATDFVAFTQQFCKVFDHPDQGKSSSQQLFRLRRGSASVAKKFRPVLLVHFCDGMSMEIQLACRDEGLGLNHCNELAIKGSQQLCGQG